jgi:hypothetical protein
VTFLNFLAWAFYWMRLELVALQKPNERCSVSREAGRTSWHVELGEQHAEAREAWRAIRLLLEGRPETEPLELSPEAIGKQADALAEAHDLAEADLIAERERERLEVERLGELAPTPLELDAGEPGAAGYVPVGTVRAISSDVLEFEDQGAGETLGDERPARKGF